MEKKRRKIYYALQEDSIMLAYYFEHRQYKNEGEKMLEKEEHNYSLLYLWI